MTDWNLELELARLRIYAAIDRRAMVAQGMDAKHINRSLGQRYTRRMLALAPALTMATHGLNRASRRANRATQELVDAMRIGRKFE